MGNLFIIIGPLIPSGTHATVSSLYAHFGALILQQNAPVSGAARRRVILWNRSSPRRGTTRAIGSKPISMLFLPSQNIFSKYLKVPNMFPIIFY